MPNTLETQRAERERRLSHELFMIREVEEPASVRRYLENVLRRNSCRVCVPRGAVADLRRQEQAGLAIEELSYAPPYPKVGALILIGGEIPAFVYNIHSDNVYVEIAGFNHHRFLLSDIAGHWTEIEPC